MAKLMAKEVRKRAGLTREQVAEAMGVSWQTVKYWELKEDALRLDTAIELCRLYGCTLDEMAGLKPLGELADTSSVEYRVMKLDLDEKEGEKVVAYAEGLKAARE